MDCYSNIPEPVVNDPAANYNDQNTQIMSRLVSEIRGGRTLQDLDDNELSLLQVHTALTVAPSSRKLRPYTTPF